MRPVRAHPASVQTVEQRVRACGTERLAPDPAPPRAMALRRRWFQRRDPPEEKLTVRDGTEHIEKRATERDREIAFVPPRYTDGAVVQTPAASCLRARSGTVATTDRSGSGDAQGCVRLRCDARTHERRRRGDGEHLADSRLLRARLGVRVPRSLYPLFERPRSPNNCAPVAEQGDPRVPGHGGVDNGVMLSMTH